MDMKSVYNNLKHFKQTHETAEASLSNEIDNENDKNILDIYQSLRVFHSNESRAIDKILKQINGEFHFEA